MSAKGGQGATQGSIPGSGGTNASSTAYGSLPSDGGGDRGGGSEDTTSPTRNNRLAYQHGHGFIRKTFRTPTNCHYCTELLWGLMGQGYICEGISEKHHQQYIIIVIIIINKCQFKFTCFRFDFYSLQLCCSRKMLEDGLL